MLIIRRTFMLLFTAVLALAIASPVSAATFPTPTGLTSTARTYDSLTLAWNPVAGAPTYRVQLSTSSSMSSPKYKAFASNGGVFTGLKPATKYYFRVAVGDAAGATALSPYTPQTYPSRTTASLPSMATPSNLRSTAQTPDTLALAWDEVAGAPRYRVRYSTSSTMSTSNSVTSTTTTRTLTGLTANTRYYFKVAVIDPTNTYRFSPYTASPFPSARTTALPPTPSADLHVGSFNIYGANNDSKATGEAKTWAERKPGVVADIIGEKADVVGLQEANQSTIYNLPGGVNQFTDLRNGLNAAGQPYELANTNGYNCAKPSTSSNCSYVDQGASNGTRIIYNTATVSLVGQGSFRYTKQTSSTHRYFAWATFQHKSTGNRFFFATTHLQPGDAVAREAQWKELIAKVKSLNTTNLPVIITGDFNTSKFSSPAATMLPTMKSAGFLDVLNQTYGDSTPTSPPAEKLTNAWINSFNDFRRDITPYSYSTARTKVGNSIDWVFTTAMRVRELKVVIDFDPATLRVIGVIPSDHNMIRATVVLP